MWPFNLFKKKEKIQQTFNPIDCIFANIVADLDERNYADWKHKWVTGRTELYSNSKKGYSLTCYNADGTAWVTGISYVNNFTLYQQTTLYKMCQDIWKKGQSIADAKRKLEDQKQLKAQFPQCFK